MGLDSEGRGRRVKRRGVLWLVAELEPFEWHAIQHLRKDHDVSMFAWDEPAYDGWGGSSRSQVDRVSHARIYARTVTLRKPRARGEYPTTVKLVSPALWWRLIRAPEDVVLTNEIDLVALFAVASKMRKGRKVVVLIEGDASFVGPRRTARFKVLFRRLVARFVDVFASNSPEATAYLTETIGVSGDRIAEGWWLAGLPDGDLAPKTPRTGRSGEIWAFAAVGRLIPQKGIDQLIRACARFGDEVGPFELRIVGEGPELRFLEELALELGVRDSIEFVGTVAHETMGGLLRSCDLLVFPSLADVVGRVVVEALSVGIPVAVSTLSGAAHVLVRDGENGVIMDPRDSDSIFRALKRATDPQTYGTITAGAARTIRSVSPAAAASALDRAIAMARAERGGSSSSIGVES